MAPSTTSTLYPSGTRICSISSNMVSRVSSLLWLAILILSSTAVTVALLPAACVVTGSRQYNDTHGDKVTAGYSAPRNTGLVNAISGPGSPWTTGAWRTSARMYVPYCGVVCQVAVPVPEAGSWVV